MTRPSESVFQHGGTARDASAGASIVRHVAFGERVHLGGAGENEHVTLEPGLYRVDVSPRGELLLASEQGQAVAVRTAVGYHGLELREPIAVHLKGGKDEESQVALLLPGGVALQAVGAHGRLHKDAQPRPIMTHPGFPDEAFKWLTPATPFERWLEPWTLKWGTVEPGASPSPLAPQTFPPNWVGTRVVSKTVARGSRLEARGITAGAGSGSRPSSASRRVTTR